METTLSREAARHRAALRLGGRGHPVRTPSPLVWHCGDWGPGQAPLTVVGQQLRNQTLRCKEATYAMAGRSQSPVDAGHSFPGEGEVKAATAPVRLPGLGPSSSTRRALPGRNPAGWARTLPAPSTGRGLCGEGPRWAGRPFPGRACTPRSKWSERVCGGAGAWWAAG